MIISVLASREILLAYLVKVSYQCWFFFEVLLDSARYKEEVLFTVELFFFENQIASREGCFWLQDSQTFAYVLFSQKSCQYLTRIG